MSRDTTATYLPTAALTSISFFYVRPVEGGAEIGIALEPPYKDMDHRGTRLRHLETKLVIDALIKTLPDNMAAIYSARPVR